MRKTLQLIAIYLFLTGIFVSCGQNKVERPAEPWVFRSVLDDQPRMVTIALHDELYVAYDAAKGSLYKAWKGGVNFDGAVYTSKHGPQPTSEGYAYYSQKLTEPAWVLLQDGQEISPKVDFKGYQFKEGKVFLKYHLTDEQGNVIKIEESPEYVTKDNKNGLERHFIVSNVPDNVKLAFKTDLTSLQSEDDYKTSGEFQVLNKSVKTYTGGTTNTLQGLMVLNSNDETKLTVYFHPGFDEGETEEDTLAVEKPFVAKGKTLIDNNDCRTCHNETKRTVGPSYLEVAERYDNSESTITELASKVINGGKGNWGEVMMTPHPALTEADAKGMVTYILSLDGEEATAEEVTETGEENIMTGHPSVALKMDDSNKFLKDSVGDSQQKPGLAANAYVISGDENDKNTDFHEMAANTQPVLSGIAPLVHITSENDLGEIQNNIYIEFKGFVNIEETSNYVFRVVSDDGSKLFVNGRQIIDNSGNHSPQARDGEVYLQEGSNDIRLEYFQGGAGGALSLQWAKYGDNKFSVIPEDVFSHTRDMFKEVVPYIPREELVKSIPGDQEPLQAVHPAFTLSQARPDDFQPRVGGMDFLSDGRLVVCTWDSLGPVYIVEGVQSGDPSKMKVKRIASGLAEPLGIKVVNDTIYVLQKQELTRLLDHDGDEIIDEYQTVSDAWKVSSNFHEFAFGLAYKDGYFYATLATAIMPGGASANPQIPDRGKAVKISKADGSLEFVAHGLRTPNGIGEGVDGELFMADNQGDWLPSSKILHLQEGAWYGSRSVDFEGTADLEATLPVVWLPQDEIGNSPSKPSSLNVGPYKGQMIHGEVTHGGIKRVFVEKIDGAYQGAVFRFIQGLEAGVNRLTWGPDSALYVGGIGNPGNWQDNAGKPWYGLQKLTYNNTSVFEPLAVRAKSNGIEIEFTEPIAEGQGQDPEEYEVQQWYYTPTADYGGPKLGLETLEIESLHMSDDRKKIFLELQGMKPEHVIYFRIIKPFVSDKNQSLWTTETWYTMNNIPKNQAGFNNPVEPLANNQLSEKEKATGWQLLFDGKTTDGWRNFKSDEIGSAWKVANGTLYLDNARKKDWQIVGGGDIITDEAYENYELQLEWKMEPGGNSGIIFNVVEDKKYDYVWQTGPEMQILDNVRHPDGRIVTHRSGDLYDMIESRFVTVNPAGEWNRIRLISKNGHVEQWQNGYKVVEYQMHTPEWQEMIENSKFKDMPDFGKAKKGHIALQDHGNKIWFRNIKIKPL